MTQIKVMKLWNAFVTYKDFGDALNPAVGFLPRPGTRWYQFGQAYQPRPQDGWWGSKVRQFYFETFVTYVEDLGGKAESWRIFTAPFNVQTQGGAHLEANWAPQYERLDDPFEISPGVVIPPGDYHFSRYRVEAQSSSFRPLRVGAEWFSRPELPASSPSPGDLSRPPASIAFPNGAC